MLSFSVHISASERFGSPCSLLHLPQPMLSCRASLKPHAMPAGGSAPPCYSCSPVVNLALSCEVCPHPHAWLLRARSIRFSLLPEDSQAEHWPATAGPFHPLTSCQLMSRHWVIRDAAGTQTDEVQGRAGAGGAGVWGEGCADQQEVWEGGLMHMRCTKHVKGLFELARLRNLRRPDAQQGLSEPARHPCKYARQQVELGSCNHSMCSAA
jgi:hypothetical protein